MNVIIDWYSKTFFYAVMLCADLHTGKLTTFFAVGIGKERWNVELD